MTDIPPASLTPIIAGLQACQAQLGTEIAALQALAGTATTPPPAGGLITAPNGSIGPDKDGATWTWGAIEPLERNQYHMLRNGASGMGGWVAMKMQLSSDGVAWAQNDQGGWMWWDGAFPQSSTTGPA